MVQNEISVYVDIIFFENFIIDFVILDICGKLTDSSGKLWRVIMGAALGALYAVVVCICSSVFTNNGILSVLLKLFVSLTMCIAAFGIKNKRKFLINNMLIYAISFVFAGIFMALKSIGAPIDIGKGGMIIGWGSSGIVYIVEMLFIGYVIIEILRRFIKRNRMLKAELFNIIVGLNGKSVELIALCDTGNELYDHLHNLPVLICDIDKTEYLFGKDIYERILEILRCDNENVIFDIIKVLEETDIAENLAIVPYRTVSDKNGLLFGTVAECNCLVGNTPVKRKATVCFALNRISEAGGYDAIAPPALLKSE